MGHWEILDLFFEEPARMFQIREISKITRIPKTTVARKLENLIKEKMITRVKAGYIGNDSNQVFRLKKRLSFIEKIHSSGLVDYLEREFNPKCAILFGSFSKGEYTKGSDIDIFIEAKEKSYDLGRFEKKLKHTVNLIFDESLSNLSKELFNNIINGTKLAGYIKLK